MTRVSLHGGVGEIGGNRFLVEARGRRLLLDFGMSFGARNAYFSDFLQPRSASSLHDLLELGLLPEIPGIYRDDLVDPTAGADDLEDLPPEVSTLWDHDLLGYEAYEADHGEPYVDGVLLTHAHADHYGDIAYLHPDIPIYGSPVTLALLEAIGAVASGGVGDEFAAASRRRVEAASSRSTFPGTRRLASDDAVDRDLRALDEGEPHEIAGFGVVPVPVDHSVPGACAFHVRAPDGADVLYTGDVRFHGTLEGRTRAFREYTTGLSPDLLLVEGTRIGRQEQDSEDEVRREIAEVGRERDGLLMVDFGWKDTTRFETVLEAARASGRTLAVDARLAYALRALHGLDPDAYTPIEDVDGAEVYVPRKDSMTYSPSDYTREKHQAGYELDWGPRSRDMKEAYESGDEDYLAPRLRHLREGLRAADLREDPGAYAVQLTYYDMNELLDLEPGRESAYIRAACEPFNEEMRISEDRQRNWFEAFGVNEAADERLPHAHASGHASGPEILDWAGTVDADVVVPIHTEEPSAFEVLEADVRVHTGDRLPVEIKL